MKGTQISQVTMALYIAPIRAEGVALLNLGDMMLPTSKTGNRESAAMY